MSPYRMVYAIVKYNDGSYDIYEKPDTTEATQELAKLIQNDERGFEKLTVTFNYKAKGYSGTVIPYSEWHKGATHE